MKRSSSAESDIIVPSDGDSSSEQPAKKILKKEEEQDMTTIDGSQSSNELPAEIIVKEEGEPIPSQEVLELKQKVAKLEKDFEIACRMAGEAQVRVRFLEEQLEEQQVRSTEAATVDEEEKNLVDELRKKQAEISTQLEDARREALEAKTSEEELKERLSCLSLLLNAENARATKEESRVASLTRQLEAEKSRASEERKRAHARMDAMVRRQDSGIEEMQNKVATLARQLDVANSTARVDRLRDQKRIDELTRKLARQEQPQMQQEQQPKAALPDTGTVEPSQPAPPPEALGRRERTSRPRNALLENDSQQQLQEVQQSPPESEPRPPSIPRRFPPKKLFDAGDGDSHSVKHPAADSSEVEELQQKVASLTRQLEGERSRASEDRKSARARMDGMARRHDEAQRSASDERKRDQERIDELKRKLAQYESGKAHVQPKVLQPQQKSKKSSGSTAAPSSPSSRSGRSSANILERYRSDSRSESISFESAVEQLRAHHFMHDLPWLHEFKARVKNEQRPCDLCGKKVLRHIDIIAHFLSVRHSKKHAPGSTVSLADFEYWLRTLKTIPTPKGAPKATEEKKEGGEV